MKMKVLLFFLMFASGVIVEQGAMAAPSMCVIEDQALNDSEYFEDYILDARYTCQELQRVATGIDGAVIVVEAGTIVSACSGAGAPVAVSLQAGALVLQTLKLVVSNMPCDDVNERKIEANVKQFVCDQLASRGVMKCNL